MHKERRALEKHLADCAKEAAQKHLVWGPSGNISHRLDRSYMLISASGLSLEMLSCGDFVRVDLTKNKAEGKKRPSIEYRMHSAVYKKRPDVAAILHSQPFFTTLLSCTRQKVNPDLIPESMSYLRRVERVPYFHPGSIELAQKAGEEAKGCDALILSNHGALCCGAELREVLLKTQTLELLCRMIVYAHIADLELKFVPRHLKEALLDHLDRISRDSV